MDLLGSVLVFAGSAMLALGIVWAIRPMPSLGMARRVDGALLVVAAVAVTALGSQLNPEIQKSAPAKAEVTVPTATSGRVEPSAPKPISKAEALAKLSISSFRGEKDGFGTVLKASFVLHNGNTFPVKDLTVTCVHAGNSGTRIDSNTRTIYERIGADQYYSVTDMNMGFIHSAATSTNCRVTNFAPA
jgi:hypothetical protein